MLLTIFRMPQESAGRPGRRAPALVLLVGLAMMLAAHVVSCALRHADVHSPTTAETVSVTRVVPSAGLPLPGSGVAACRADHDADEHPGDGIACCDPADRPAELRASSTALILALLLPVLTRTGRATDPLLPGAKPGGAGPERTSTSSGPHLLRLVCVSRT